MELLVQNLSKSFGDKTVLENINFSMQSGEFVTYVGSSGCGKSTLLRLIAGSSHQRRRDPRGWIPR